MSEADIAPENLRDTERLALQTLTELRANVHQLVGRCVLQAQHFEQLLKAVLPCMDVEVVKKKPPEGPFETINRSDAMVGMTLGGLVKEMLVVQPPISTNTDANDGDAEDDVNPLGMKFRMRFPLQSVVRDAMEADLRRLVALRNDVVHHLLERHPLDTVNDISAAEVELTETLAEIQACGQHIRNLVTGYVQASRVLQNGLPQIVAHMLSEANDVAEPPTLADIHGRLREFAETHSVDGWAVLDEARASIQARLAGLTLKSLGFSTWRHLLSDSQLFDLKRAQMPDGAFQMHYRIRVNK